MNSVSNWVSQRLSEPSRRAVTAEHMTGVDYPATTYEMTLTPVERGALLSLAITHANSWSRPAARWPRALARG